MDKYLFLMKRNNVSSGDVYSRFREKVEHEMH